MAGVRLKAGLAAILAAAVGAIGWACAGGPDAPEWTLTSPEFNEFGSGAMLLPSNDTRMNLLLLLADRPRSQREAGCGAARSRPVVCDLRAGTAGEREFMGRL